jgi:uncharacterized protein (TIGR03067 family)
MRKVTLACAFNEIPSMTGETIMRMTLAAIVVGLTLVAGAAPDDAVKKDLAQLQGEWSMVSFEIDGKASPPEDVKKGRRTCRGNETTLTSDGQLLIKAKFTLDPAKKPKAIDYQSLDGVWNGMSLLGIYEVEGDTLKFCVAEPGVDRPKEFSAKQGSRQILVVWKREKK